MAAISKDQVLVVDDEKEICFLLSKMLKKIGFDVHSANSVSEGRKLLKRKTYKLIFLDLGLPDGLGFSLIPYTKKMNADIKVIMITAFEGDKERKKALIAGAHYFMPKPFNGKMIAQALTEFNMVPVNNII